MTVVDIYPMWVRHLVAVFRARGIVPTIERRDRGVIVAVVCEGRWRLVITYYGRRGDVRNVELYEDGEPVDVDSIAEAVLRMFNRAQPSISGPAAAKRSNSVQVRRSTVRRV